MREFRLYLRNQCLINPPPEAPAAESLVTGLLGFLAPKLIEAAISGIGNILKKAGQEKTEQVTADEFADLYVADDKQALGVNPALGCVIGVWFEPDRAVDENDEVAKKLKEAGLVPAEAAVGGVFEAAIRTTLDGTAFYLDARHFSVRKFLGDRRGNGRDFVVTLGLSSPDAGIEGDTFALGRIDLGTVARGDSIIPAGHPSDAFPRHRSNLMPWSAISRASKAAYDRDVGAGSAQGRRYMPVTFSLTVSETDDGNRFLLRLGELLSGAAEDAAEAISKRILPEEIARAEAEEATRAEKLYEEELKAELAVRKAQKKFDEADEEDKPVLFVELELARRKLAFQRSLREAAGLPARELEQPE